MNIFLSQKEAQIYQHRSRSSYLRDIENGLCTKPIKVGSRSVVWLANELEQIRAARIAGLPVSEIKKLVNRLHEERITDYHCKKGDKK
jgi:predicted DNA-binding transcriptional regulator AlpA